MTLIRFSPLEEMRVFRNQMERLFEPMSLDTDNRRLSHALPVEVTETAEAYRIRALVPGVPPEKIDLQAAEGVVTISYETEPPALGENEAVHMNQFAYGKFSKKLSFPERVDADGIRATYEYGILTVTLPKADVAKPRQIDIQVIQ